MAMDADNSRVRASVAELRRFYAVGRKSLDKYPDGVGYGGMNEEAAKHRLSAEMLRKARALAAAYTQKDLDSACRAAQHHGYPLGVSHVILLLSVGDKPRRNRLQRDLIEKRWSKRELDAEIRKRFGNRNPTAGRRQTSPETAEDAYYAIGRLCRQWERLMEALDRPPTADAEGMQVINPAMPPDLRKLLTRAAAVMGELGKAVSEKLDGESGDDRR